MLKALITLNFNLTIWLEHFTGKVLLIKLLFMKVKSNSSLNLFIRDIKIL